MLFGSSGLAFLDPSKLEIQKDESRPSSRSEMPHGMAGMCDTIIFGMRHDSNYRDDLGKFGIYTYQGIDSHGNPYFHNLGGSDDTLRGTRGNGLFMYVRTVSGINYWMVSNILPTIASCSFRTSSIFALMLTK